MRGVHADFPSLARGCRVALIVWLACCATAAAQELTLTRDSEANFRRLMYLAQTGTLGADVHNVNIGLDGPRVRLELVRRAGPTGVLMLGPRRAAPTHSRYFEITLHEHATEADRERVGRALDECFPVDPFQFAGLEESLTSEPLQSMGEAWMYGGWRGVLRALERRAMALASLEYVVAVSGMLALGFTISLLVLWSAAPNRTT